MRFEKAPETILAPSWKILVCKGGCAISFVSICQQYVGLYTHWYGGHTVACSKPDDCACCDRGTRREFKAYLAAEPERGETQTIIQITHTCTLALHRFLSRSGGILGLRIKLERAGKADTSMLQISMHGFVTVKEQIKPVRLEKMLARVFAANAGIEIIEAPDAAA